MEVDEPGVYSLLSVIHQKYIAFSGAKDREAPVKEFTLFGKIAKSLLPKTKQNNPGYITNATVIVLCFFEFCEFGSKTASDSPLASQRSLFEGME